MCCQACCSSFHVFTKPFPACEKQAASTQMCKLCLANVTPFCQRCLFDAANTTALRSCGMLVTSQAAVPPSLPLLPGSEEHVLGPWACLMPLKSEEGKSDSLLEETQHGKAPITVTKICSEAGRSRSGLMLLQAAFLGRGAKANQVSLDGYGGCQLARSKAEVGIWPLLVMPACSQSLF